MLAAAYWSAWAANSQAKAAVKEAKTNAVTIEGQYRIRCTQPLNEAKG